jgi:homoserine dehydrogenase
MRTVPLLLIGFGNVGQAVAELLLAKDAEFRSVHGLALQVVGIGTGSHGAALDPEGLSLIRALQLIRSGGDLRQLSRRPPPSDLQELLQAVQAEAVLESTPVNYESGQPAVGYLTNALERGMHAITANKGPVVHAFAPLTTLAASHSRQFRFEAAVMDGAPIFSLWRECLPAARLESFRGILNSTTNLILSLMEQGEFFVAAVAEAQRLGLAESDPSGDVEGWDSAIKVAILVTVLMGVPTGLGQVQRRGIEGLTELEIRQASQAGRRWKLVCSAKRIGEQVEARVGPERLDPSDPLFHVMGTSAAVTFVTDVLGELTIRESAPGPRTTAYGMLADLLNCVLPPGSAKPKPRLITA